MRCGQDLETLPLIQLEIKKALKVLPKVDMLQPFRVHFVQFGAYCLVMQVSGTRREEDRP